MINTEQQEYPRCFAGVKVDSETVVVGAGIAGISAALTSARQGKKTVLITDRPILGGSASSEIRVGPCGAAAPPHNRFARETGIIEEIFNHLRYMAQNAGKWRWFYFDQIYFDMVLSQENLNLYLNTSIYEATTDGNTVKSLKGLQLRSETIYEFTGKVFIDCTGDGTVGFLSGAHYRIGREGKSEFDEVYSPDEADRKTMGATLLFTTVDAGHPVAFKTPEWAVDIKELPSYERINRSIHTMPDGSFYGFWWVEYGGDIDSIHDDGEIMLHLRRVVNGIWGHIKNSGNFSDVENQEINWIGYLPGKRESRRLMGSYIVTAHDMTGQRKFDDSIGYTGWPIDIHPPEGYLTNEQGCTHDYLPGITDIPFRCIYSKNINNLLFAGRHISCSHEALGTLRVISTTSVMGQAAGMAACMCLERGITPEAITRRHMGELQHRLMRDDQSIIGKTLMEDSDLSRTAYIEASSEKKAELTEPDDFRSLDTATGLVLPVEKGLDAISLLMEADAEREVTVDIYPGDGVSQNYRIKEIYRSVTKKISRKGWYKFEAGLKECPGNKAFIIVRSRPGVKLYMSTDRLTGILGIESVSDTLDYETIYRPINYMKNNPLVPCFKTEPVQRLYRPSMVNNGHIRPYGLPNSWLSGKMSSFKPEWLELTFKEKKTISKAEIVFNSDLNPRRIVSDINSVNAEMVKSYELIAVTDDGDMALVSVADNHMRFVRHEFNAVEAVGIRLVIHETWGNPYAEVVDLRIYG